MLSIAHETAYAADELWAVFAGLRQLDEAADGAQQARADVARVAADARWEAAGVRKLRRVLIELDAAYAGICSDLTSCRDRVAAVIL
ncbi:hypothetical protein ACFWHT_10210 [Microbacterium sp. NPDC058342]|uniref:hypothetical protein n=1 Tax=Microbacterium sp. NPDC058342 TaxID=3346454 RepID=UPI0036538320